MMMETLNRDSSLVESRRPTPVQRVSSFHNALNTPKSKNDKLYFSQATTATTAHSAPPVDFVSFKAWLRSPLTRGLFVLVGIGMLCLHLKSQQKYLRQTALQHNFFSTNSHNGHYDDSNDHGQQQIEEELSRSLSTTEATITSPPTLTSHTPTASTSTSTSTSNPTAAPTRSNGLCAAVGTDAPLRLWMKHIDDILAASRHVLRDSLLSPTNSFRMKDHIAYILQLVTPRLHLAQRAVPRNWKHVENVASIVDARLRYLQQQQQQQQ